MVFFNSFFFWPKVLPVIFPDFNEMYFSAGFWKYSLVQKKLMCFEKKFVTLNCSLTLTPLFN